MRRSIFHVAISMALVSLAFGGRVAAAEATPQEVDLARLRTVASFHHGRVMPLDTLAKVAVESVCDGGTSVKLGLQGYYEPAELKSSRLAPALKIFPAGEPRRMAAVEVLLSWLVETEKWEDVPFIACAHNDIHGVLGLKSKTITGLHRKHVTPRTIAESEELVDYLADFADRQRAATTARQDFEPTETDKRVRELLNRYRIFRKLTHDPRLPLQQSQIMKPGNRDEFLTELMEAKQLITQPNSKGRTMLELLQQFIQLQQTHGLDSELAVASQHEIAALAELERLAGRLFDRGGQSDEPSGSVTLEEAENAVVLLRRASIRLEEVFAEQTEKLFDDEAVGESQAQSLRPLFRELAHKATDLKRLARQMHLKLYDNGAQFDDGDEFKYGATVYVVPALNPAALAKDRSIEDVEQRRKQTPEPWLALQAVLYGSDDLLYHDAWPRENYNRRHIEAVRQAWSGLAEAYTNRDAPQRAEAVSRAQEQLATALQVLGKGIEANRLELVSAELPKDQRDEDLIAYTKYPAGERLAAEVTYNRVKPFQWSWVISLAAVFAFALSFGVMQRQAFWTAMAILAAAILWTAYGFYLRVMVTQWAPVTNMYETVIFVPWVVAVMAAWLVLLPLTWTGISDAWRLTSIPGSWEAAELDGRQRRMMQPATWNIGGGICVVLRIALMAVVFRQLAMVPYADGNRPIFYLQPEWGALDLNGLFVYLVNLVCLAGIVWFLPRVILTCLISLVTIPWSWTQSQPQHGQQPAVRSMMPQVYSRWIFGICGAGVACFFFMIAAHTTVLDEDFRPLQPVLRSNFWLTIHVLTIVASYGAGLLAWGIGLVGLGYYLFGRYRDPVVATNVPKGLKPAGGDHTPQQMGKLPPEACATLSGYAYRAVQVAVLLLAAGTILGGLWADVSWGRFWGWDPKEVWALISLLVYLAILHGRYAGWFNNFGMIVGTILGATMIAMSWYGVNFVLPKLAPDGMAGLHSYGAGAGGLAYVASFVGLNVVYLLAACVRYTLETRAHVVPVAHTPEVYPAELSSGEARPHGA